MTRSEIVSEIGHRLTGMEQIGQARSRPESSRPRASCSIELVTEWCAPSRQSTQRDKALGNVAGTTLAGPNPDLLRREAGSRALPSWVDSRFESDVGAQ